MPEGAAKFRFASGTTTGRSLLERGLLNFATCATACINDEAGSSYHDLYLNLSNFIFQYYYIAERSPLARS